MAEPVGTECELHLQTEPGAWSRVLGTESGEAVVGGPGGRPSGLATPWLVPQRNPGWSDR